MSEFDPVDDGAGNPELRRQGEDTDGAEQSVSPCHGTLHFGEFTFDVSTGHLSHDGFSVHLTARSSGVLRCLLRRPEELILKEEFLETVWEGVNVRDESLTQAISLIRQAIGDSSRDPRFIETVSGEGYRFIGRVTSRDRPLSTALGPELTSVRERSFGALAAMSPQRLVEAAAAVVLAAVALGLSWNYLGGGPGEGWMIRRVETEGLPQEVRPSPDSSRLSPDGAKLAWVDRDRQDVMMLDIDAGRVTPLLDLHTAGSIIGSVAWSRDGRQLAFWYFTQRVDAYYQSELHVVDTATGEDSIRLVLKDLEGLRATTGSFDWSPDGSRVMSTVRTSSGIQLLEIDLADGARSSMLEGYVGHAKYSPDGEKVAYSLLEDDRWAVFIRSRDGSRTARVSESDVSSDDFPMWSPDGRHLLFRRTRGVITEFLVVAVDGFDRISRPIPVHRGLIGTAVPASWATTGELLFRSDSGFSLYTLEVDPLTLRARGGPTAAQDPTSELSRAPRSLAYGPTSDSLAVFTRHDAPSGPYTVLFIIDPSGTRPLLRPPDVVYGGVLGFSSNGSEVFHWDRYADGKVSVLRTDVVSHVSEEVPVMGLGEAWYPMGPTSLSPRGDRFVVRSAKTGGIGLASVGSGQVVDTGIENLSSPVSWSADETEIVGVFADNLGTGIRELRREPLLDGRKPVLLRKFDWRDGFPNYPLWSSDGQHIIYVVAAPNREPGVEEIHAMPAAGGDPIVIFRHETTWGRILEPRWSPDGSALMFLMRDEPSLYLMRDFLPAAEG